MSQANETLNQLLIEAMDCHASESCLFIKQDQLFQTITFRQFRMQTFRLAADLQQRGMVAGDRLALVGRNSLEWFVAFVAGHLLGAIVVPIRDSLPAEQLLAHFIDCDPAVALIQEEACCLHIANHAAELTNLRAILTMEIADGEIADGEIAETIEPLIFPLAPILKRPLASDVEASLRAHAQEIAPSEISVIYYVTSPDDKPYGAFFDQGQEAKMVRAKADWCKLDEDDLGYTTPQPWAELSSMLPTLHYFTSGVANALTAAREINLQDLQHISPTVTLTTPFAFAYMYQMVMADMQNYNRASQAVFQWALTVGKEYHEAGLNASTALRERYQRADMTFFSSIRGMLGGRLRRIYSTGAPLAPHWTDFAEAIGLLPLNVYGVTKAGGFPAASRPSSRRAGSVGRIAPGFQIRIADDGEVLVRGDTVMRGIWNRPDVTASLIDDEGWLSTGDLGRFDADGFLYLTGYKESLLVLSTGRKIFPTTVEEELISSPYIAQALVCGEGQRQIVALIVPDLKTAQAHLYSQSLTRLYQPLTLDDPALVKLIADAVQQTNATLDEWDKISQYTLLEEPFHNENGELIDDPDAQRTLIHQCYAKEIGELFPAPLPFVDKTVTQVQLEPEQLRQLLEKEDILDAWLNDAGISFLIDLARAEQIDAPSLVHICETVAAIAQMQSEERPLSTALVVGNHAQIARVLPESALQLRQYDHIRHMRRIITSLAKIVDGIVLAFAVDKHGFVRGVHRLQVPLEQTGSDLPGLQFRHLAAIARACDAVVFSIPVGGRQVRVFADGQLVGRYVNGAWMSENLAQIDSTVLHLAERKGFDVNLLNLLLRCAFTLSERNLGAILLIGDADEILRRSDRAEIQDVATVSVLPVQELSDEELIAFARQDGATVIDTSGELRGCMVLLRPAAATQAQVGPGRGARHSSAAKMSAETHSLAITISQDGPIVVYDDGQRVLSL